MKKNKIGLGILIIVIGSFLLGSGMGHAAEKFPDKAMDFVVPSSPGSGVSVWAQLVVNLGGKIIGQPINVLHKPGGNANQTFSYVYRQPADGYAIGNYVGSAAGYMNFPQFETKVSDFIYVMQMMRTLYCLYVRNDSEFKTIQDVIQYAKKNPGKLDIGTNKVGSVHFVHLEKFSRAAGIKVNNIPYKGVGRSMKDVLGKHLNVALAQPFLVIPKKDLLRPLLLFNEKRLPQMADVPVPADLGYKYPINHQFYGVFLKKGTPSDRVAKIKETFKKVIETPEFKAFGDKVGNEVQFMDSKPFTEMVKRNTQEARKILVDLKVIK